MCERCLFEQRDEEINVKKILTVDVTTFAVVKRKPEKIQACQDSNPDLCDTRALHWYHRGQCRNPQAGKPEFFQAFFLPLKKRNDIR